MSVSIDPTKAYEALDFYREIKQTLKNPKLKANITMFGVYDGWGEREFVVLRQTDSIIQKIWYFFLELIRLIKTDPRFIKELKKSYKAHIIKHPGTVEQLVAKIKALEAENKLIPILRQALATQQRVHAEALSKKDQERKNALHQQQLQHEKELQKKDEEAKEAVKQLQQEHAKALQLKDEQAAEAAHVAKKALEEMGQELDATKTALEAEKQAKEALITELAAKDAEMQAQKALIASLLQQLATKPS